LGAWLYATAVVNPTNAFAVGEGSEPEGVAYATYPVFVAYHRDAAGWHLTPVNGGAAGSSGGLRAVAATATSAYAVGYVMPDRGTWDPLVVRWDGSSWQDAGVPLSALRPAVGDTFMYLPEKVADPADNSVTVLSGTESRSLPSRLTHWNGHAWSARSLPRTVGSGTCKGVVDPKDMAAASTRDIWIVGTTAIPGPPDISPSQATPLCPLVLHWDGRTFSANTNFPAGYRPVAVTAHASVLWVVGRTPNEDIVVLQRTTTGWHRETLPPTFRGVVPSGIAVRSRGDVWISGTQVIGSQTNAVALHRVNGKWVEQTAPANAAFYDVAAAPGLTVLVGARIVNGTYATMIDERVPGKSQ
jgi:hypothetical protein